MPLDIALSTLPSSNFQRPRLAYLAFLVQYGILIGGVLIFMIFKKSFQIYSYFKNNEECQKIYLFIIIYTLIASLFEVFMTGINDFNTILFWFSLAFLSYSKYKQVNEN